MAAMWREPPYAVEAWKDRSDEERKVSPLDMPEHSDWVLYYPHPDQNKDPTMLHNTFMYELSARLGRLVQARVRAVVNSQVVLEADLALSGEPAAVH